MRPLKKSNLAPAKKAWSAPQLRRIQLTDQELGIVTNSANPSSALASIYRERLKAERGE